MQAGKGNYTENSIFNLRAETKRNAGHNKKNNFELRPAV